VTAPSRRHRVGALFQVDVSDRPSVLQLYLPEFQH
jgi:hypothetical protein